MAESATDVEVELRAKEIARRLLWRQPHSQIISELGLTMRKFSYTIKSPHFKMIMERLEKELWSDLDARFRTEISDVQKKAREASVDAIDKLINLMTGSASETLQRDCANDVIKYSGAVKDPSKAPNVVPLNATAINILINAVKEDDDGNGRARTVNAPAGD